MPILSSALRSSGERSVCFSLSIALVRFASVRRTGENVWKGRNLFAPSLWFSDRSCSSYPRLDSDEEISALDLVEIHSLSHHVIRHVDAATGTGRQLSRLVCSWLLLQFRRRALRSTLVETVRLRVFGSDGLRRRFWCSSDLFYPSK